MVALGANPSFIARTIDREPKHMSAMFKRAEAFRGTSLIEIYQNCNIFNDGAFKSLTERDQKADNQLLVEHGKPLVFGKDDEFGIVFENFAAKVVRVEEVGLEAIAVHDETGPIAMHMALASMGGPGFPTAIGVIRAVERATYDGLLNEQLDTVQSKQGRGTIHELLHSGDTWTIES